MPKTRSHLPIRRWLLQWAVALGALCVGAMASAAPGVVLHEQDAAFSRVRLYWVIRAGSLFDPPSRKGLASFTARALMRGTTTRPYADLQRAFQALSATWKVETSYEFTTFEFEAPAPRFEALLYLLRDLFSNPEFDPIEADRLRSELFTELQSIQDDPVQWSRNVASSLFFRGTPAQFQPRGDFAGLRRITAPEVRRFFTSFYGDSNMILALASPYDESWVRARVHQILQGLPQTAATTTSLPAGLLKGWEGVVISDLNATEVPFHLLLPGVARADADRLGLEIANRSLGVGTHSWFGQVQERLGGALTTVSTSFSELVPVSTGDAIFSVFGTAQSSRTEEVVSLLLARLREFIQIGSSELEFLRARDEQLASASSLWGSANERVLNRLEAVLAGAKAFDPPSLQSEVALWNATRVADRFRARFPLDSGVLVVTGDPSRLVPFLQAIPGMGPVHVFTR
ncbi:MAG: hypothetical protein RJB38_1452 [Pseudomonadota bacterium]